MKPEEMTAEELVNNFELACKPFRYETANRELLESLRAELIARLNAGGASAEVASLEPCEDCVWHGCQGGCGCKCHKKGASQPLQPTIEVRPYKFPNGNDSCFEVVLGKVQLIIFADKGMADRFADEVRAEFFSAPPAMPAPLEHIFAGRFDENWTREQEDELLAKMLARRAQHQPPAKQYSVIKGRQNVSLVIEDDERKTHAVQREPSSGIEHAHPASPQLEQVAREIAENNCEHFADGCRADYVNRFTAQNLAILQRHFPGSEGAEKLRLMEAIDMWYRAYQSVKASLGEAVQLMEQWKFIGFRERAAIISRLKEGAASPPVAAAKECGYICRRAKDDPHGHATVNPPTERKSFPMPSEDDESAPLTPREETKE